MRGTATTTGTGRPLRAHVEPTGAVFEPDAKDTEARHDVAGYTSHVSMNYRRTTSRTSPRRRDRIFLSPPEEETGRVRAREMAAALARSRNS